MLGLDEEVEGASGSEGYLPHGLGDIGTLPDGKW
jgi:hypothetical protein